MNNPKLIIVLTGTGRCAKEFLARVLHCVVGEGRCYTVNLMDVVQRMWFIENIENNPRQAGAIISSNAKEKQRKAMEAWSYEVRHQDPGRFCRISCGRAPLTERWFVCGIKCIEEIEWFKRNYGDRVKTVRIHTSEIQNLERLWTLCRGDADDVIADYDLEDYEHWDMQLVHSNLDEFSNSLEFLTLFMQRFISY